MARIGPQKPRQLKRVLQANGLRRVPGRGKGSHEWWEHRDHPRRAAAVPDYDIIDERLLKVILREVGKTPEEYLAHLH